MAPSVEATMTLPPAQAFLPAAGPESSRGCRGRPDVPVAVTALLTSPLFCKCIVARNNQPKKKYDKNLLISVSMRSTLSQSGLPQKVQTEANLYGNIQDLCNSAFFIH